MKKILLICIMIIVLCSALTAAADPIKVAINPDTKPFKYLDENGEFAGIDADVINSIAEAEGLEIEFVEIEFDKIMDAVASCEVDAAISALTKTENRSKMVSFSEPYIMGLQSAFIRLKNDGWKDISDSAVKILGAKSGTTAEENSRIAAERLNLELKHYPDYAELFEALENDEIDVAISDELLAKQFVDSYGDMMTIGQPLTSEPYAIAVCPNNTDLLETINHGMSELRKNGTLDEILLENLNPAE